MLFESPYDFLKHQQQLMQSKKQQSHQKAFWQGLCLKVGTHTLLTPVDHVVEILPISDIHPLPGVQSWIKGVIQVRGNLVILNDLQAILFSQNTNMNDKVRMLIIQVDQDKVGFLISSALNMVMVNENTIQAYDVLGPYVSQAWKKGEDIFPVIDLYGLAKHPSFLQASKYSS